MGNLLTSLLNSSNALRLLERGMEVVGNNVSNVNTPGYTKQRLEFQAQRFQLDVGLPGGVSSSGLLDSREEYAERDVRRQQERYGYASQKAAGMQALEPIFDIQEDSGISASMNQFFQSLSALTVAPNDTGARQVALERARALATSFNATAGSLAEASRATDRDLNSALSQVQAIGEKLLDLNKQFRADYRAQQDAGLNAQLFSTLEDLSQIVNTTVLRQEDGSVTVYLGGQSLFLLGDHLYPVTAEYTSDGVTLKNSQGDDITGALNDGRIGALVSMRNEEIPSYTGDLNHLAAGLADAVNNTLAGGVDANGNPPAQNLFVYDPANAAKTLAVNDLAPEDLALASPGAPQGNGNALLLAQLDKAAALDGFTFSEFYGNIAAHVGRGVTNATELQKTQDQIVAQAKEWRQQVSGVSLDEEAVLMLQYQRSYQAAAKMVTTLDEMTQTLIDMIR